MSIVIYVYFNVLMSPPIPQSHLAMLCCRIVTYPAIALVVEGVPRPATRGVARGFPGEQLVTHWYHRVDLHLPRDRYFPHRLQLLRGLSHLLLGEKPVSHDRVFMVDSRKRGQFRFFQFIGYNFCNSCSTLLFFVPNYAG